jgi:hypothetical protein
MPKKVTGKIKGSARSFLPKIKGRFPIARLPDHLRNDACKDIEYYSVGLALHGETFHGELIGSGTLVKWGNNFGILTAEHVVNNPKSQRLRCDFLASSKQRLQIICTSYALCLDFELRFLRNISLSKRLSDKFGPDCTIIILPQCPKLGDLKARKSFWPLDIFSKEKIKRSLSNDGFHIVMGYLGSKVVETEPRYGNISKAAHCLCGQTFVKKYFRKGKFDFVDVDSDRNPKTSAPDSYEGMSGGGLWKITVGRKKEEDAGIIRVLSITLAGVVFYQSKEVKLRRIVRCHGPKTIYKNLLAKLEKEFSV